MQRHGRVGCRAAEARVSEYGVSYTPPGPLVCIIFGIHPAGHGIRRALLALLEARRSGVAQVLGSPHRIQDVVGMMASTTRSGRLCTPHEHKIYTSM